MALTSSRSADRDRSFEVRLEPHPSSASVARREVRGLLDRGGRSDLVDAASLLVSEVVTNALLHAGTEIDVTGRLDDDGLVLTVGDGSPHLPSRRHYAATSGTGRGLMMLDALGDDWGVTEHPGGKTVWFRLSQGEPGIDESGTVAARSVGASAVEPRSLIVELQNMPLLLHSAWQEHAEALLREHLLANLGSDGDNAIQVHADATDAIAILEEHVPDMRVAMHSDRIMNGATEPGVSAARVDVPVPWASVPHFRTLDRAIEAALDLSSEGLVLAPPTQPEVQAFRRWLCRQVQRQADGAAPEPWVVPSADSTALQLPPGWDPSSVTESARSVLAADQASRILAVSPSALDLLGYDDPAELVGDRIVTIVPQRFRQAHVAGYTMYQLVGRRPLIDEPVRVPALCRDGSEVLVELHVREVPVDDGRMVLLGELIPVEE